MEKWFRFVGRCEGASFLLLLLLAVPLKYYAHFPLGVRILGPVHGLLFIGYCVLTLWCALDHDWPIKKHLLAYVAAILPFGTFWFERVYLSNNANVVANPN